MNTNFVTQRPLLWSYTGYQLDLELSTLIDTFKILHGLAPSYLLSFISFRRPSRYKLRSSNNNLLLSYSLAPGGEGGTLGISGWGCAAGTLEPLTYTRASSAEFCYPILE